ncbi:hypothetical protein Tco_0984918, partial [Tanacetum coccineum]
GEEGTKTAAAIEVMMVVVWWWVWAVVGWQRGGGDSGGVESRVGESDMGDRIDPLMRSIFGVRRKSFPAVVTVAGRWLPDIMGEKGERGCEFSELCGAVLALFGSFPGALMSMGRVSETRLWKLGVKQSGKIDIVFRIANEYSARLWCCGSGDDSVAVNGDGGDNCCGCGDMWRVAGGMKVVVVIGVVMMVTMMRCWCGVPDLVMEMVEMSGGYRWNLTGKRGATPEFYGEGGV